MFDQITGHTMVNYRMRETGHCTEAKHKNVSPFLPASWSSIDSSSNQQLFASFTLGDTNLSYGVFIIYVFFKTSGYICVFRSFFFPKCFPALFSILLLYFFIFLAEQVILCSPLGPFLLWYLWGPPHCLLQGSKLIRKLGSVMYCSNFMVAGQDS